MINEKYVRLVEGTSNLVLSMPHSATSIPKGIEHRLNLDDPEVIKSLKIGVDFPVPFVSGFYEYEPASKVWTTVPRMVVDVNRLVDQVDELAVEGQSTNLDYAQGLIPRATISKYVEEIRPLLNGRYTQQEFQQLLEQAFFPYVSAIKESMGLAREKNGMAIVFELHSMAPQVTRLVQEGIYKGTYLNGDRAERGLGDNQVPDILLLDKGSEVCSREITDKIMEVFSDHGLLIKRGRVRPTKTGLYQYCDPKNGLHATSVEIVGHTFDPHRMEGVLEYDPSRETQFKNAFNDVYRALESVKL